MGSVLQDLTDPYINLAFIAGNLALVLVLVVVFLIIVFRLRLIIALRREVIFNALWRPLLAQSMLGVNTATLPKLRRYERLIMIKAWNRTQETVTGDATACLNDFALNLSLDVLARKMLLRTNRSEQLMAIFTLGNLRDKSSWAELIAVARSKNPVTSLTAVRALVQIDAASAIPELMDSMLNRYDWEIQRIAQMLKLAKPEFERCLNMSLIDLHGTGLLRALHLADALHLRLSSSMLMEITRSNDSVAVLVQILKLAQLTPDFLIYARSYLQHADALVRAQASQTMGLIGEECDIPALAQMLSDEMWSVRYQAALALVQFPALKSGGLEGLIQKISDPKTLQLFHQIQSEKKSYQ
jgi:hypothetical protein